MKDSIEFYVDFITEIEKNPILYNHTFADHSNRRLTEIIWTQIGDKFGERSEDCRSKWKSIRSAYIRSLKPKSKSGSVWKKKYYLAQYLEFLNPFVKTRPQLGNIPMEEDEILPECESQIEESSNNIPDFSSADEELLKHEMPADDSLLSPHSSTSSIQSRKAIPRKRLKADKCTTEYFTQKKPRLKYKQHSEKHRQKDPCEMFLSCLVPHMKSMTQQQQLGFQRGVLDLIEIIKYRQVPGQSLDTSSSNSLSSYTNSHTKNHEPEDPLV